MAQNIFIDKYFFRYNEDSTRIYVHIDDNMLHLEYESNPDSANIRARMVGNDMLYYAYDVQTNDTLYTLALSNFPWVRCNVVQSVADNNGRKQIEVKYVHRAMYETNSTDTIEENDTWLEGVGSLVGLYCNPFDIAPITHSALFCASFGDELIYLIGDEKYKAFYKEFGIISPCHEDVIDAVENVATEESATKVLIDGQLYIIRNGITYDIDGRIIR